MSQSRTCRNDAKALRQWRAILTKGRAGSAGRLWHSLMLHPEEWLGLPYHRQGGCGDARNLATYEVFPERGGGVIVEIVLTKTT